MTTTFRQLLLASITAFAACSSEDITTKGGRPLLAPLCDPSACESPAPLSPNYLCENDAIAGPACVAGTNNECAWEILECPGVDECTPEECGDPPLGVPNWTCEDTGVIGGPACQRDGNGVCGWLIIDCPPTCVSPAPGGGGGNGGTAIGTEPDGVVCPEDPTDPTEPDDPTDPTEPPPQCECSDPGPAAPNYLCENGQSIAGPACVENGVGDCGWVIIGCAEL